MNRVSNWAGGSSGGKANAYRKLTRRERHTLVRNGNTADDWNNLLVSDGFLAEAVHRSAFYGVNRIGNHTKEFLSSGELRLPVGISDSTIISCHIGDDAAIHHVRYLSGYLIGSGVILFNIDEMTAAEKGASENDLEKELTWIAVANENGGRRIASFSGMTAADAYLWSRNRDRLLFQKNLLRMTVKAAREGTGLGEGPASGEGGARTEDTGRGSTAFGGGAGPRGDSPWTENAAAGRAGDSERADRKRAAAAEPGIRCRVGDNSVLRSCRIIEEAQIGEWARISGANF